MSLRLYKILFWTAFIGIPVFLFCMVNTMVSLKYETGDPDDCVSRVTGANLCQSLLTFKILTGVCIAIVFVLLAFRKRLLNETPRK